MLVRHAGASRFAFNQFHRLVTDALTVRRTNPQVRVPWSGFDLLNAYNAWKGSEAAGRVFSVARDGVTTRSAATHLPLTPTSSGFVGVDRGLAAFAVAATAQGTEVGRYYAPKPRKGNLARLRRRSRAASRTKPRSGNHVKAICRLSRQHARINRVRRSFLHEVSSQLVKTHGRLCLEGLGIANLVRNKHMARAISDAAWAEFARQLHYKAAWFGAELVVANRWFPSTKTRSGCGKANQQMRLAERVFGCHSCGLVIDRDRNAAINLATWAKVANTATAKAPDRQAGGRVTNAPGGEGADRRSGDGEAGSDEGGTDAHAVVA
jgi:putative transposase